MAAKKNISNKTKSERMTVKLVWGNPTNIPTIYANNLYITHAGNEFYLVFGEIVSPIFDLDHLPEQLEIKPVAKIAVTPENMVKFVDAIAENMAGFKEKVGKLKGQHDDNLDH